MPEDLIPDPAVPETTTTTPKRRQRLTARQRRRINRQNAQKSTGPKSPEGKRKSSMNSCKLGLRIENFALLSEHAPELRERLDEWLGFYKPASPGERELLELAVMASVGGRRSLDAQTEARNKQIRTARIRFDREQEDA